MDYDAVDEAALHNALLALRQCPWCREDLQPVGLFPDVWGCKGTAQFTQHVFETWYLPQEKGAD